MTITPEQFKDARHQTGLSQDDVAQYLGVSLRTVKNWELGTHPIRQSAYELFCLKKGVNLLT